MVGPAGQTRAEYEAVLAARRELGPDYEPALVDSFADRLDQVLAERDRRSSGWDTQGLVIALVTLGVSVPVGVVAAIGDGLPGLIVAWTGLVGINVANAWGRRRTRKR